MPGDTKIKRTASGWIDVDAAGQVYAARWQARNARRYRLQGRYAAYAAMPKVPALNISSGTSPAVVVSPRPTLTSLEDRLFDRLTNRQGVSPDDALTVIQSTTYNKAASYGHIRAAGASHDEAFLVINIGLPAVSVAYGLARSAGKDHTTALREALSYDGDD